MSPLNNHRNNRRRGRGSNRSQGGNQLNRIDSRARGNAPQLLEKYRKMAHDASLNGDRVQAEYYLQFADHYFRVIADAKARQEEHRAKREEERERERDDDDDEDDSPRSSRRGPSWHGEDHGSGAADTDDDSQDEDEANEYEPAKNPFTRSNRERAPKRSPGRPKKKAADDDDTAPAALDPASLPPSIASQGGDDEPAEPPRRRGRPRKKPAAGEGGEELEKVG